MEKLLSECDGKSIVLQVDFFQNASSLTQNEVQSARWNHTQAAFFTANAWFNENSSKSFAIASDHLTHTKDAVYTLVKTLYKYIKEKYSLVKLISTFSDGAPTQVKHFLLADLHPWENEFNINLIWHFFALPHGKGAVDGIGAL